MSSYNGSDLSGLLSILVGAGTAVYQGIVGSEKKSKEMFNTQSAETSAEVAETIRTADDERARQETAAKAEEYRKQLQKYLPIIGIIGVAAVVGIFSGRKK